MVTFLAYHRKSTAKEMAEKFEVSTRTIYRDLDALSSAGIPVYAEKGRNGGIGLLDGYVLDQTLFLEEEKQQLLSLLGSLSALGTPDTDRILDKLGAMFGKSQNWLEVDLSPWGSDGQAAALFRLLKQAILSRQVVAFHYAGQANSGLRQVEPYVIKFRGQGWYLQGFCLDRQDFRFFKLNRMVDTRLLGQTFAPRVLPEVPVHIPPQMVDIVLHVQPNLEFRAYDDFMSGQVEKQEDGSLVIRFSAPSGDWLVGYLLSFGPSAQVLEPDYLRQALQKQARAISLLYPQTDSDHI